MRYIMSSQPKLRFLLLCLLWSFAWGCTNNSPPTDVSVSKHINVPIITDVSNAGAIPLITAILKKQQKQILMVLDTGGAITHIKRDDLPYYPMKEETFGFDANGKYRSVDVGPGILELGGVPIQIETFSIFGGYIKLYDETIEYESANKVYNLGQDVLSRFVVTIDGPNKTLILDSPNSSDKRMDWSSFSGFYGSRHLLVKAENSERREFLLHIDTGLCQSIVSKDVISHENPDAYIKLGNFTLRDRVNISNRGGPILTISAENTRSKYELYCILGWDVLKNYVLRIDYPRGVLKVEKPHMRNDSHNQRIHSDAQEGARR